jgi:uncharacterized protein (TIGR02265 family)
VSTEAAAPPEAKANGFNTTVRVLQAMLSPAAFARVVEALPPETAELIAHKPLPLAWLPVERYGDLIATALRVGFGGEEERIVDVGRRMIVADLKTLYRMFIKLLSPQYVIERATKLWLTYNRNNGIVTLHEVGAQVCDVHYEDVRGIYPGHWAYQRGVICGIVEAAGYRHVAVKVLRGGRNEHGAVLQVTWG